MNIVFILLSVIMLLYMVGRKIDFFSIATVCTIIYNYYCAMGTVFISSHEKAGAYYYYSDILPQVYFIVIAELLILFAAMVIYDRRKPLEHIRPGYNEDVFSPEQQNKVFVIACIVSNLILLTNVASIGLPAIFHHLYNFGNTSVFIALGKFEKRVTLTKDGPKVKTMIPMGLTLDERICGGASFSLAFNYFKKMVENPQLLEQRPEKIVTEVPYKN